MAIVFQNGTATNRYDLTSKIQTFLSSNGWTVNGSSIVEGGGIHLSKGGRFFNIFLSDRVSPDETLWLHLSMSTGYAAPVGGEQPGEVFPNGSPTGRQAVNFTLELYQEYYFFLDTVADAFYAVVEETVGVYRHFGFGGYNVIGQAAGGGEFVWGNYLYANTSGAINGYNSWPAYSMQSAYTTSKPGSISVNRGSGREVLFNSTRGPNDAMFVGDNFVNSNVIDFNNTGSQTVPYHHSVSNYNGRIAVLPIHIWVERPSSLWSLAGQYANVRLVNLENIAAEQIIDGDWMCFPLYSRSTTIDYATGNCGLAYKRV